MLKSISEKVVTDVIQRMRNKTHSDDVSYLDPLDDDQREELFALASFVTAPVSDAIDFDHYHQLYQARPWPIAISPEILTEILGRVRAAKEAI